VQSESERRPTDLLPRPLIGVAVGLVVVLAVGVIVVSLLLGGGTGGQSAPPPAPAKTGPVALGPVPAPAAGSAECSTLLAALPPTLPGDTQPLRRAQLAQPAPQATVAWDDPQSQSEPVVLRCGLERPPELTPTSELRDISGVLWLPVEGDGATSWYLVDRPVYVALTVPADTGTGPLQDVSAAAGRALTKTAVRVG
jgi:uncharacterized protein DUF3515